MKNTIKIFGLLFMLVTAQLFAQTDQEKAHDLGEQAVKLEDEGKYDDALSLLTKAQKMDPDNCDYPYEMGYTYYLQKEYKKAIDEYKKLVKYKCVTDQCYQMLGNAYDATGDSGSALKAYNDGLKVFPKSGRLYLEIGNVYWDRQEYNKALPYYEEGIESDPAFPSNYYRATKLYLASDEKIWGMLYGEIFMNLERNTDRTAEISKLLYDGYKDGIKITSDSSEVDFCHSMVMSVSKDKKPTIPYCLVYTLTLSMAVAGEKSVDINSLDRIRTNFVENYFKKDYNKTYPNILFEYHNEILKSGNLEAYNHWILMKGDEDAFATWQTANKDKWDNFVKWFTDNPIPIDDTHKFCSSQYQ